jgi:hypothetical protein
MAARATAYSFKNVVASLDGQRIVGGWDGDNTFEVAPVEDAGALLMGAGGDSLYSVFAGNAVVVTLRLMHTSPAHELLLQKLAEIKAESPRMDGFALSIKDIRSNDGGSASRCYIQGRPTNGYGKNASVREWKLIAGDWVDNVTTSAAA